MKQEKLKQLIIQFLKDEIGIYDSKDDKKIEELLIPKLIKVFEDCQ